MKAALTAGLAWFALAGCYAYRPLASVETAMPAPGTPVQVRLTTEGATALATRIGPDILYLQGAVVSAEPARLTLTVSRVVAAYALFGTGGSSSPIISPPVNGHQ